MEKQIRTESGGFLLNGTREQAQELANVYKRPVRWDGEAINPIPDNKFEFMDGGVIGQGPKDAAQVFANHNKIRVRWNGEIIEPEPPKAKKPLRKCAEIVSHLKTKPHEPANPCAEGRGGFKGLTKRETMAAMIMAGICSREDLTSEQESGMAAGAVRAADELIEALNNSL